MARLRAHCLKQLAHEPFSVTRPKFLAGQISEPGAALQMRLDNASIVRRVAITPVTSPRLEELADGHGRPLASRERSIAHLALPLSFQGLGNAAIGPGSLPDL